MTRRSFVAAGGALAAGAAPRRTTLGAASDCFPSRRGMSTIELVELAAQFGSSGTQGALTSLEADFARRVRARLDELGMFLVVSASPVQKDFSRFVQTVKMAKEAGAVALRAATGGRRYEDFNTLAERQAHVDRVLKAIREAVPVVEAARIPLGIENHKDFTLEEHVKLLRGYSSEYLGACIDTGNNISILEDPIEVVEGLAPFGVSSHLKDAVLEEYAEGFLLGDIVLGDGMMDLKRVLAALRKHRPGIYLTLEMITRDPLRIPCLTDKYWATFPEKRGIDLARTLRLVRANKPKAPLIKVSGAPPEALRRMETENVTRSLAYARESLGLV